MTRPYEVQWRRGSTSDHEAFVGLPAEITINSDNWEARIHDGQTAGGHRVAKADLSNVLSGSSFENALLERVIEEIISRGIGSGEGAAVASIGATTKAWASPGADWLPLRGGDVSQAEWPELYENIGDQFAMESSSFIQQTGIIVNTTSPTNQNMNEIASFGETVVIVGASGSIWTTTNNGRNWTVQTVISSSTAFLRVVHGAGLFVAISATAIATSPDGLTWTQRTTTATAMALLRFVNGTFVILSTSGGQVTSSTDGETWTTRTHAGFSNVPRDVTFFAGLFVAVGDGGRIATSPDLTEWTNRTSGTTQNLAGIAHNGTIAVAVGGATTTSVTLSSTDGITWTTRTNAAAQARTCVLWSPSTSRFWSGGNAGVYITSTDGIAWVTLASTVVNDTSVPNQLYEFNGFIFTSYSNANQPSRFSNNNGGTSFTTTGRAGNRIAVTESGSFWLMTTGTASLMRSWPNMMNRLYGVLGAAGSAVSAASYNPAINAMLVKASGGWAINTVGSSTATLVMTGSGQSLGTLNAYINGTWICGGQGNNFSYSTDNGATWTAVFLPAPTSTGFRHVAFDGTTWVLTGDYAFAGPTLESLSLINAGVTNFLAPLRSESRWVIPCGAANTFTVLTSTDGASWTQLTNIGNTSLVGTIFGGVYANGRFVLVGGVVSGFSFMSEDGLNWIASQSNAVTGNSGYAFRGVVHGNGLFMAVGGNALTTDPGVVAVSIDGIAWYARSVGANAFLTAANFHFGTFFAHTTNGDLFASPNGTSWTRRGVVSNASVPPVNMPFGLIVYGTSGVVATIRTTVVPGTFRLPFVEPLNQFDPPSWIKAR